MKISSYDIDIDALAEMRAGEKVHTVLDVREATEVAICALKGSLHIPLQQVPQQLDILPQDHPLIVLCHHGTRSAMVTAFLRNNGFENAWNLAGGVDAWARQVEPGMARY